MLCHPRSYYNSPVWIKHAWRDSCTSSNQSELILSEWDVIPYAVIVFNAKATARQGVAVSSEAWQVADIFCTQGRSFPSFAQLQAEMSIGLDLIRLAITNFFHLDWIQTVNRFMNLGSGLDLDWVNGKNCGIFVKLYFVNFLDFIWT